MNRYINLSILIILFCFWVGAGIGNAQVYFCTSDGDIGLYNPQDCSTDILTLVNGPGLRGLHDIALTPDGEMLVVSTVSYGDEQETILRRVQLLPELTFDTLFVLGRSRETSLVCDSGGNIYVGGIGIKVFDESNTGEPINRISAFGQLNGDLMWFDGLLYGSNSAGLFDPQMHPPSFGIHTFNPEGRTVLSHSLPALTGLCPFYSRTQHEVILLAGTYGQGPPDFGRLPNGQSAVWQIELSADTAVGTELCRFRIGPLNSDLFGFTSEDEFRTEYALRLDLDADNSSGRFIDHYEVDSLCTRSFRLADQDVSFYSELGMPDSLVVHIHTPPLGEAEAYLSGPEDTRFRYRGMGSRELVVYPNAVLGWAGWEELVRGLRLNFGSGELPAATRRVDLAFYVDGRHSEPARAFVEVQPEVIPYAGRDSSLLACRQGYNLTNLLGEDIFPDGYWSPALVAGGDRFRPWQDTAAVYTYVAQQGDCPADSATISITRAPRPATGYGGIYEDLQIVYLCPGDTAHWTVSDTALDYWSWSDGSEYGSFMVTEPGVHNIDAWDTLGCYWYTVASFRNLPDDWDGEGPYLAQDTSIHCQGSTISYQTHLISRDTLLCDTFISTGDCDYLNCRQFLFIQPEVYDTVRICEGEYYLFDQRQLTEAGTYERLLLGESCETLQLLTLEVNPRYERNLIVGIPPGGSYTVGDSVFTAAGQYRISLQTEAGCDSIIRLRVEISTATEEAADINCQPGPLLAGGQRDWPVSQPGCVWTKLEVYDVLGRLVYSQKAKGRSASLWPVSAQAVFPAGGYFYRLSTADGIVSGRVVLVR